MTRSRAFNVNRVPAELWTVRADNGDPLLLYGTDADRNLMLWPTPYIERHKFGFARWCREHVSELRGAKVILHHELTPKTLKWARWLGVKIEAGQAAV